MNDNEVLNSLVGMAYDEIEDVRKYMDLFDHASDHGKGILKDIAHDEYTHALNIIKILDVHKAVPDDLWNNWNTLKKDFGTV